MQEQHRAKLGALQDEKEAQMQHCHNLMEELQRQLQYIQYVVTQLNDKEACLEATYLKTVQDLKSEHAIAMAGNASV